MNYDRVKTRRPLLIVLLSGLALIVPELELQAQTPEDDLALLARPGHHAIIRHAIAPGTGDPSHFEVGDCTTQRNLSQDGREQAAVLGEAFRAANIVPTEILSSAWCRALDTAELMDIGPVQPFEPLNSIWTASRSTSKTRTHELLRYIAAADETDTLLMVTHAVNISALTGQSAESGHGYIIRISDDRAEVVGSISPP